MTEEVAYPRHPAHLDAYVEILGPALTVQFLLRFGGRQLYLPSQPKGRSEAEQMIGKPRLAALSERFLTQVVEVPIANTWLIQALTAEGLGTEQIVARMRLTRKTVQDARRAVIGRPQIGRDKPLAPLPLFDIAQKRR